MHISIWIFIEKVGNLRGSVDSVGLGPIRSANKGIFLRGRTAIICGTLGLRGADDSKLSRECGGVSHNGGVDSDSLLLGIDQVEMVVGGDFILALFVECVSLGHC